MSWSKQLMIAVGITVLVRSGVGAAKPKLADDAVVGVWETIIADDVRVIRMELGRDRNPSLLAMSVGRVRPITSMFVVEKIEVKKGRQVVVEASQIGGTDRLVIRGSGVGVRNDGRIHATVSLHEARGRELNRWKADFVNLGGRYLETVAGLAKDAQREIEESRSTRAPAGEPAIH